MGSLGLPELLVILFIILLLFGARKLPDLASGLGGAVNSFRKAMKGDDDQPKTIDSRQLSGNTTADPVPTAAKTETKV
ncbi:MAG TPA: twin-arginine translocase TatA/TatE family subunit [Myxococcota bacterium]|jgi:sec-independent protein translocase protein TatA